MYIEKCVNIPVDQKLALYAYICGKTSFWSPDPEIQGPTLNFKYIR